MNKEARFQGMLEEICGLAKVNGNRISKALVEQFFEEQSLKKEQFDLVYGYFTEKNIRVEDEIETGVADNLSTDVEVSAGEAQGKDDAKAIDGFGEEVEALCLQIDSGKQEMKDRLAGIYLNKVVEIANSYANEAVLMEDLIQEGNLGLVLGIEELSEKPGTVSYDRFLTQKIQMAILEVLEEEYQMECADEELEKKVNEFHRKVLALEEDLERKPSLEEVSMSVKMSLEEVKSLFHMMGEDVEA